MSPARGLSGWLAVALATLAVLGGCLAVPGHATADATQISIIEDDALVLNDPGPTILEARQLGAGTMRLMVRWQALAPDTNSSKAPGGFDGADPADYSASAWKPYDTAIEDAVQDGLQVDLDALGGSPLWATGPDMPKTSNCPCHNWDPDAVEFGRFVRALGERYSGDYDPETERLEPGNPADLPRVSFWSIWNEPDYGPSLAPQGRPGTHGRVLESPRVYRGLIDAAWSALQATGHPVSSDTILIGELAPRATGAAAGNFNGTLPMTFIRALYCESTADRPLHGAAAVALGCPTTAAGSKRFAAENPGLFDASGFSDHPYMRWYPPGDEEDSPRVKDFSTLVRGFITLGTIGNLETGLDRILAVYGSHRADPIWDTEFAYITSPPKRRWKKDEYPWVNQATAAEYDNWAEYLSWRDPRIKSFDQYLLQDPLPTLRSNDYGGYASGLLNYDGTPKPGFDAWRMPLFLPKSTAASPSTPLEVWGAARPIDFAELDDPGAPQAVNILFKPKAKGGAWSVIDTIAVASMQGYFETRAVFPSSGTIELQWTYPDDPGFGSVSGTTVSSRQVQVTVR